jgi:hypothetical protein
VRVRYYHWEKWVLLSTGTFFGAVSLTAIHELLGVYALFGWVIICLVSLIVVVRNGRRAKIRETRIRKGLCRHCGYSGGENSLGTCPECGMPFS